MIKLFNKEWSNAGSSSHNIYFSGHLFFEDSIIFTASDFLKVFVNSGNDIKKIISGSNGNFSIVVQEGNSVHLICDIVRSKPLFYIKRNNQYIITDRVDELLEEYNLSFDVNRLEEYIASGYVYGSNTAYENVYGVQAGESVVITGTDVVSNRYFKYNPDLYNISKVSLDEFTSLLDQQIYDAIYRMVKSIPSGSRYVLPLSGGHDSRIIINYLYKLGIKNVMCFSYGVLNNEQSVISKNIADSLGYEWHFIEYTEDSWQVVHDNGLLDHYASMSFGGTSIPHLQDFLAVHELNSRGILKPGDIFIPGHSLDFLAGSHLFETDLHTNSKEAAIEIVINKYAPRSLDVNTQHISISIEEIYNNSDVKPSRFKEFFNWQERQAKFIVNSLRAYEIFGFDTRIPLWDRALVEFWLTVPAEERVKRKIFFEAEKNGILIDQIRDIPFAGENTAKKPNKTPGIAKFIPKPLLLLLLKITKRKSKTNEGLNNIYVRKAEPLKTFYTLWPIFPGRH